MNSIILGILLIVLSASGFAVLPILGRYVLVEGQSLALVMLIRFGLAALLMFSVSAFRRFRDFPRGRTLSGLIMIGGGCWLLQSFFYFSALARVSASLTTILLYTYPGLVILMNAFIYREKISMRKIFALGMIFCGIVLALGNPGAFNLVGVAFGLAAGFVYALYIVIGSNMMKNCSPVAGSSVICASTALVYAVIVLFERPAFVFSTLQLAGVGAMALCSTFIAILCFFAGVRRVGVSNAAIISTLEPVLTILMALTILKESMTLAKFAGAALIVVAVLLSSIPEKARA